MSTKAIKLTETQRKALGRLIHTNNPSGFRFATLDALRRMGLVERYTRFVVAADFATEQGVYEQYRSDEPRPEHEWWITHRGRDLLAESPSL